MSGATVTVGAMSVLLLILRTSMEDPIIKKFSPLCALSLSFPSPPAHSNVATSISSARILDECPCGSCVVNLMSEWDSARCHVLASSLEQYAGTSGGSSMSSSVQLRSVCRLDTRPHGTLCDWPVPFGSRLANPVMNDRQWWGVCRDSDDWMDREDGENGDEEGGRGNLEYPRGSAVFSGAAADDAAVLAARASAIVDKGMQAQRGRPTTSRNSAAHNGSTPLEIIAPGSQGARWLL